PHHLPASVSAKITSCYLLPYPKGDGFHRVRLFPPVPTANGRSMRYCQPSGSAPRLYLPTRALAALADPTVPLWWTEGEKKALAGDQAGLACVGLGGLWNWLSAGQPIPDLDRIAHVGRTEILPPASDVWVRPDLLRAVYALGRELEGRGARVTVLKIPAGADSAKWGLDDYLPVHTVQGLDALPRLA